MAIEVSQIVKGKKLFVITIIGELNSKNAIVGNSKQETNIPRGYAAGDICTYEGKVKLVIIAFREGPTAVNIVKTNPNPNAKV